VSREAVPELEPYGELPRQVGEWWLPPGASERRLPTVVLVHGGFWRSRYDRTLEHAVAADLAGRGYLVWNVDYRSSEEPWPSTLLDAAAAYDHLAVGRHRDRVDADRVSVVGHSAGGHLALWLASRDRLPDGAPGAGRRGPRVSAAVSQAGVAALSDAARAGLGNGAALLLVGGRPDDLPDRYAVADPLALVPTGVPTTCVHGEHDEDVPLSQSETYVAAAGPGTRLVRFDGGHDEHLNPDSGACVALRAALA